MRLSDALLAVAVAAVWGLTFVAMKIGLQEAPPFLLVSLRFALAAFPALLVVPPPKTAFWKVALYGVLIGVGQFGLLFTAMGTGMPAGLASLVLQSQVFLTIALAGFALGERPTRPQMIGSAVAVAGLAVIGAARFDGAAFLPFALTIAAAVSWAAGNVVGKTVGRVDPLAFTIWSSLAAPAPMLAASLAFEPGAWSALTHPTLTLALSVGYLAFVGTLFGYGAWARLLLRYPAAAVTPFALLVPVVGMISAWAFFREALRPIELAGAVLVMAGLGFNVLGDKLRARALRP